MNLNCPSCNSENTQRLSLIYESGISTINTKSNGFITGVGNEGTGVGGMHQSTKGQSQSTASQKAAPPERKKFLGPLLLIGLIATGAFFSQSHSRLIQDIVTYAWLAASAWWIFHALKYNWKVWPALKAAWDDTFQCQRCNHVFTIVK